VNHETVQAEYVNVERSGKVGYSKTLGLREGNTRKIVPFRALLLSFSDKI
jgi:hypothetical protein